MGMDKNTILAVVLSGIVLLGYLYVDTKYIMPKQRAAKERQKEELAQQQAEKEQKAEELSSLISAQENSEAFEGEEDGQDSAVEPVEIGEYVVETDKIRVVLTNRGGDVVSYKLLDHLDKDTGEGVEMVDNISSSNRAFSLAFGNSSSPVINEPFNVKKIDDYTIGFYRDFYRTDSSDNQRKFRLGKLYSFKKGDYTFKLSVTVNSADGQAGLLDVDGAAYCLRTSPQIGPHFDRKANRYEVRQYLALNGNKRVKPSISDKHYYKPYSWAGVGGKYFTILVKPENIQTMSEEVRTSNAKENGYENAQVFFTRNAITESSVTDNYYIYVGPRSEQELIKYNSSDKNAWGLIIVRFIQALNTSGFFSLIEVALKWAMEMIYRLVHNWGISIIILTIILKFVLFPLNKATALGSVKMQKIQPQIKALQEKYKDNQPKMQEEMGKLYKQVGYNPAAGCLPMVLQMLVLFALYNVFNNYFEFRGASFIKGWIDDLSVGDKIFTWKQQIPFISAFTMNTLRLLPFIYTGSQLLNGVITQYGNAAGMAGQSQGQMKFMMYGMPIMFFFMFYNVPSGLLLYWTVSNILQIGQQVIINKMVNKSRSAEGEGLKVVDKNTLKFQNKKGHRKSTR